ncbi:MAG: hypothetical protein ABR958_06865 [Dehalococcoidales bacterium]
MKVLYDKRPVKPEFVAQLGNLRRYGLQAERGGGRISGHDIDQ